jgi:EmrB/QacA subfamily drug resistance transporter
MAVSTRNKQGPLLAVLFVGVLMGALDISIIGPALPAMRSSFDIGDRSMTWLFSIYILFNVVATPLLAKLSDRFGRRAVFSASVALFGFGSIAVATAPSFGVVLAARALQGFGAGGIFPVASAVVGESFPEERRGSVLGLIGAVWGMAFIIGPLLGMAVLSLASWHWLFLINVPIAIGVIVFGWKLLPTERHVGKAPLDWAGLALTASFLAALTLALSGIDARDALRSLAGPTVLPFLLAALAIAPLLAAVERRAGDPVVRPSLFGKRQLKLAYALAVGAGFGEAILVFIPSLGLASLGAYGIATGNSSLLLFPVVIAMAIGSPLIGRLVDRIGPRPLLIGGVALMSAGMLLFKLFPERLYLFILAGALVGLGLSGLLGSPVRYLTLRESSDVERSSAQAMVSLAGSLGQLAASALTGAIVESSLAGSLAASSGAAGDRAAAYANAFFVVAILGLPLLLAAFGVKNGGRGASATGVAGAEA